MSNGRHFNPPTPAYRPRDPFAAFEPRSAERIPSCEVTLPLPSRPRQVRVDNASRPDAVLPTPTPAGHKAARAAEAPTPRTVPTGAAPRPAAPSAKSPASAAKSAPAPLPEKAAVKPAPKVSASEEKPAAPVRPAAKAAAVE